MTVPTDKHPGQQPANEPGLPSAGSSLRAMWTYTVLRFGLFGVLWLILWLARVETYLAALIAIVLSIPLSYILFRRQRDRLATNLERRIDHRRAEQGSLDDRLSADHDDD